MSVWVRLSDDYYDNPKFQRVSCLAELLYLRCLAWSSRNLTDGFIPYSAAARLAPEDVADAMTQGAMSDASYARGELAGQLVGAELWHEDESRNGFLVHDYHDYNRSRTAVLNGRAQKAKAGRAGAASRWQSDSSPQAEV